MSDSDVSGDQGNSAAAEVAAMLQPIRKQVKKYGSKLDKLESRFVESEKLRTADSEQLQTMATTLTQLKDTVTSLKERFDSRPWQLELEKQAGEQRASEKRLGGAIDDMKVQLGAHAQVFQSAQASVAQQAHELSGLQAEATETGRRVNEELRGLTTRMDHMRGEFSERVTHTFGESTAHADRLVTRVQQDLLRVEQEVGQRATLQSVSESSATQLRELQKLQNAHDELGRTVRGATTELTDLREQSHGWALKSALSTSTVGAEGKFSALEEGLARLDQQMGGLTGTMSEGRFGQRQSLMENRQMGLERAVKQLEMTLSHTQEELAQRPLKTDVISAIATQELAVEACASAEAVAALAEEVKACAAKDAFMALSEAVNTLKERQAEAAGTVADLRETSATKAALLNKGREVDGLKQKLEEKMSRDECASMLQGKLDRAEAMGIMQAHEQLQAAVVNNEAQTKRLHDAVSSSSAHAMDATGSVRQLQTRTERLQLLAQELDGRISARKAELGSIVKVVRLLLEDAEMRCAIDEADGSAAAEVAEGRARGKNVPPRGIPPLNVNGVTLHSKAPGGYPGGGNQLTPMPPAADKVWYKSALTPRPELLGQRKRLLVNARHSWVGDQCLARSEDAPRMSPRDISECRQNHHAAGPMDDADMPPSAYGQGYGCYGGISETPGSTAMREATG